MNEYYYASARVRALEAKMLTAIQLERMAAAADFSTAFSVLSDTPYSDHLPKLTHPFDFEELCKLEYNGLLNLIQKLSAGNKIILALQQDINKDYFEKLKSASKYSSPLIKNMVNHKIDLSNIKLLLRTNELKKDKEFLKQSLLEPGLIDKDIMLGLYAKSIQDIISKLSFTPYFPDIAEGIEYYIQNKSFYLLEKLMDDFILNQFRKAKYLNSGIEPLVGFFLAKESEIKTLRFIMICKKNHVESERIKERLRVIY
jgi:vacuolar-type H+-ATPase subunit C/Vma6